MESSSLDAVLSGQVEQPQATEPPQTQEVVQETVEQQPQETTGEQTGTPPEAKQDDPLEKHRKGLEAAAAAERKRRQDAEQRAEAAERRARELEQQFQRPKQPEAQAGKPKPTRAEFASEDEWMEAVLDWRDEQRVIAWQEQQKQVAELAKKEKTESALIEASKLPGFDINAFARLPVSEQMAEAILDSDVAPQLVHFLTTNPQEAARIHALPAPRQFKELARIEDRLSAPPPKEEPEPKDKPRLPETLTQARDARGRFEPAYSGPTPLNSILK